MNGIGQCAKFHVRSLSGFKNRISTLLSWMITFTSNSRGQLATTSQWVYARLALDAVEKQLQQSIHEVHRSADQIELAQELDRA